MNWVIMYDKIIELVNSNPGQLSVKEYEFIYEKLHNHGSCNFLVFGAGNDSKLWLDINKSGKTVFIENNEEWIDTVKSKVDGIDIRKVDYTTVLSDWMDVLNSPDKLHIDLGEDVINTVWDFIFIDSPMGFGDNPGRMQSIYSASQLTCDNYFLHDVDRPVEFVYGDKYLGVPTMSFDRLSYWGI